MHSDGPRKLPSPAPVRLTDDDAARLLVAAGWHQPPNDQDREEQEAAEKLLQGVEEALGWLPVYAELLGSIWPANLQVKKCLERHLRDLEAMDPANWTSTSRKAADAVHKPPGTYRKPTPRRPSTGPHPRDARGRLLDPDSLPTVPDDIVPGWGTMTAVESACSEIIRAAQVPGVEFGGAEYAAMWWGEFRDERVRAEYKAAVGRALDEVSTWNDRGNPADRVHMAFVARLTWVWLWHSRPGGEWRDGVGPTPEEQRRWRNLPAARQLRLQEAQALRKITEFVYVVADLAGIADLPERETETVREWIEKAVREWRESAPESEPRRISP